MQTINQFTLNRLAHEGAIARANIINDEDGFHVNINTRGRHYVLLAEDGEIKRFRGLDEASDYLENLQIDHVVGEPALPGHDERLLTYSSYEGAVKATVEKARQNKRDPIDNKDVMAAARSLYDHKKANHA